MGNCWPKPVESLPSSTTLRGNHKGKPPSPVNRTKIPNAVGTNHHHPPPPPLPGNGHANISNHPISTGGCSSGAGSPRNLKKFSYTELKTATRNFRPDTVLGEGGFGRVFKGWIDEKTYAPSRVGVGIPVAVKKSNPDSEQGLNEWKAEVDFLGKFCHPNLVKLLGYCWEDKEFLLVYEYMQRGSLESHLFRKGAETLAWDTRLKIAVDAARGLDFLHSTEKQVIYRDFKASNILLDMDFNAKLSDFGLAKLGPVNGLSHITTQVVGTYGYAAPEYMATGHLYVKSDVYGFGVVLLEILSGRRVLDLNRPSGEHNLVDWAKPLLPEKRRLRQVMDPQLEGQYPLKAAHQIAQLILKCLEADPKRRPSMEQVLQAVEEISCIQMKPRGQSKRPVQQQHHHPHPSHHHARHHNNSHYPSTPPPLRSKNASANSIDTRPKKQHINRSY